MRRRTDFSAAHTSSSYRRRRTEFGRPAGGLRVGLPKASAPEPHQRNGRVCVERKRHARKALPQVRRRRSVAMPQGSAGRNVRKAARFAGKDCDPLHQPPTATSTIFTSSYAEPGTPGRPMSKFLRFVMTVNSVVGEVGAELEKEGAKVAVQAIAIVVVDHGRRPHNPGIGGPF